MKCFIYDLSNDGIIWVGTSLPIANRLRQGILDCDIGVVYPVQKNLYEALSDQDFINNHTMWSHKSRSITELPKNSINSLYTHKRELAAIRSPAFVKLILIATIVLKKIHDSPVPTVENDLAMALTKCDPDNNVFDYSVTEYGLICSMSPAEAYKEIKLYVENMQTQKIRVHSYIEYFSKKINNITTRDELIAIVSEIDKKFIKDSYI
jgi:hypothetical protein